MKRGTRRTKDDEAPSPRSARRMWARTGATAASSTGTSSWHPDGHARRFHRGTPAPPPRAGSSIAPGRARHARCTVRSWRWSGEEALDPARGRRRGDGVLAARHRKKLGMSQVARARRLGSSQSRVATMEGAHPRSRWTCSCGRFWRSARRGESSLGSLPGRRETRGTGRARNRRRVAYFPDRQRWPISARERRRGGRAARTGRRGS